MHPEDVHAYLCVRSRSVLYPEVRKQSSQFSETFQSAAAVALAAASAIVDQTIKRSPKARGSGSSASASRPTNSVHFPCPTLPCSAPTVADSLPLSSRYKYIRAFLRTVLRRTGGIGVVLAACATAAKAACSLSSHVSHLPPLGITQPPVTPAFTPLSVYRKSKTATPRRPFF